ncbi:MAG: protein kinase [Planctomycetes bacterium]|nr:protein kinase [Planctomycetota bacterium]
MPMLLVERGNDKGLSLKVEPGRTYVVGRDNPQASLTLSDPMASRGHFQITAADGAFLLRDMKSRNGTTLNDEKLAPETDVELRIGDKVQVGETIFSFLSDAKEESAGGGLIGKTIGGYLIQERVGRGGMGTVYRAEQISLKRTVALKVLSAKLLSDPVFVEKFVQEARAAGGLIHPNIVQVIDVGSDRGIYYFSMEFMDHGSVGDIVAKDGPIPWARGLEILTDAAKGLIFAEKKGIIHRDIKPDNLMLTAEGTVKIGDLGLAKKADDGGVEGGQIFGTPHFIAPEQAQGKPIDHRADLYALGATFYRVLSGKTPFSGENVKEILVKQVREEPVPLKKLVADLPDEMAAVIAKLMQKKPEDRYRSAQGLYDDLELIRVRYHLEAHGQAASARRSKVIAVVAVLAVLAVGGYAFHLATRPKEVEWRDRPEDTNGRNNDTTPVVVEPTPAEKAESAWGAMALEASKVYGACGTPEKTWQTHGDRWEGLAKRYSEFAEKHAGTPKGDEAKKEAEKIRSALETARTSWEARKAAALDAWLGLLAEARGLADAGQPAKAVALLDAKAKAQLEANPEFLPKEKSKEAADLAKAIVDDAEARVSPLIEAVRASAPKFPGHEFLAAAKTLREAREGLAPPTEAKDEPSVRLRGLSAATRGALREGTKAARDAARAALASDTERFFRAYLRIRRLGLPRPEGTDPDPADATPFFEYRWDEAIAAWKDLLGKTVTKPFRDRVEAKIRHYEACRTVFATMAAKVRSRELKDPEFPEFVRRGVPMTLDATAVDRATPEGVAAIRVISTSNRQKVWVDFRQMTPREIYGDKPAREGEAPRFKGFLNRMEGISCTAEERLALAVFLAEAGEGDVAWDEYSAASTADPAPAVDPALRKWIEDECSLYFLFVGESGPREAWRQYQEARSSGMDRRQLEEVRKALERKFAEFMGEERVYTSDIAFLLGWCLAGPDGPVPPRLLPLAVEEEVVRTLGTGADPGLEDAEERSPEPVKDKEMPPEPQPGEKAESGKLEEPDKETEKPK